MVTFHSENTTRINPIHPIRENNASARLSGTDCQEVIQKIFIGLAVCATCAAIGCVVAACLTANPLLGAAAAVVVLVALGSGTFVCVVRRSSGDSYVMNQPSNPPIRSAYSDDYRTPIVVIPATPPRGGDRRQAVRGRPAAPPRSSPMKHRRVESHAQTSQYDVRRGEIDRDRMGIANRGRGQLDSPYGARARVNVR